MTVEEKLNQAAGTIEEGVKKYPSCKNFMIFIHIISVAEEKETSVQISIRVSTDICTPIKVEPLEYQLICELLNI